MPTPTEAPMLVVSDKQAQTMLNLSRASVWRLIRAGDLEVVHIGRSIRITVASIERVAATGSQVTSANYVELAEK